MKNAASAIGLLVVFVVLLACVASAQLSNLADKAVDIQQAQAVIESARAAQESAKAAQIASAGLADVARMQSFSIMLLFILVFLVGLLAVFVVFNSAKKSQDAPKSQKPAQHRLPPGYDPRLQLPDSRDDPLSDILFLSRILRQRYQPPETPQPQAPIMLDPGDYDEEKMEW